MKENFFGLDNEGEKLSTLINKGVEVGEDRVASAIAISKKWAQEKFQELQRGFAMYDDKPNLAQEQRSIFYAKMVEIQPDE